MRWQQHNQQTSRWIQKRAFLQRKIAQFEHGRRDRRDPFRGERMARHYKRELAMLGAT